MGVVEAKLTVKKDEPSLPHPPPPTTTTKFMETMNEELARMKMEKKPTEAAGDQEMAAIADDAGPDQAPESPRKVEAKGDGPRFPQRPDEPDCAFYMKTGTCKFGMNCKFNHPPKRREQWDKLKKQSEDGQTVEEKRGEPGTKMMRQTTRKVDEKETKVGKFVEKDKKVGKADEKEKKIAKNNFRQENAGGKQKGPLRQVEQTETKVVNKNHLPPRTEHKDNKNGKEEQGSCGRLEQQDNEVFNKEHLGPRTDPKDDEASKDKQNSWGRLEQLDIGAAKQSRKERTSEKIEVRECKFHTMPGGCKFGKSCKYVHSQTKTDVAPLELNFLGLPIRPGAKECSYYMRTGNCKFATNCKYHHPDPTEVTVGQDPLPFHGYQNRGSPIANLQPIAVEVSPVHVMSNVTHATRQGPTSFEAASPYYAGTSLDPEVFHSN